MGGVAFFPNIGSSDVVPSPEDFRLPSIEWSAGAEYVTSTPIQNIRTDLTLKFPFMVWGNGRKNDTYERISFLVRGSPLSSNIASASENSPKIGDISAAALAGLGFDLVEASGIVSLGLRILGGIEGAWSDSCSDTAAKKNGLDGVIQVEAPFIFGNGLLGGTKKNKVPNIGVVWIVGLRTLNNQMTEKMRSVNSDHPYAKWGREVQGLLPFLGLALVLSPGGM